MKSPLTIVGCVDDIDLRNVSWNQRILERESKSWNLQHGQAVVYTNVSKDKVRLIAVFYGMSVLILPPIDPEDKISLYLKINQFLSSFSNTNHEITKHISQELELATERLQRSEKRKEMAKQAMKNRKSK